MFTGIVEEIGSIAAIQPVKSLGSRLKIKASKVLEDVNLGDSIAVNGICLTVTEYSSREFAVDVMPETMKHSNLGSLKVNSPVNLERAMAANGRFGGHIVSGHVDGTAKLIKKEEQANAIIYNFQGQDQLMKYMIPRGSITIDGISLTLIRVEGNEFAVSIIPHTKDVTILGAKKVGDMVNIETDMMAKYVERLLVYGGAGWQDQILEGQAKIGEKKGQGLTMELLMQSGMI